MNTPEILEAAADLIDKNGWWNGNEDDRDPATHCVATALNALATDCTLTVRDERVSEVIAARLAFAQFLGVADPTNQGIDGIPEWNDAQPDKFPVTNALRKCAEELR